jgi:hypothetical protein
MVNNKLWIDFFGPDFDRERYGYQWKAFLKDVHQNYRILKLSPAYAHIKERETGFGVFLRSWSAYRSNFPKDIIGMDLSESSLTLRETAMDAYSEARVEWFREEIVPVLIQTSSLGQEVKSFIYSQLNLSPIGLEAVERNYGFLLLKNAGEPHTEAYKFYISTLMDTPNRKKVHLEKTAEFSYSLSCNFNNMKTALVSKSSQIQSTYLIESEMCLPIHESIRPLAKKKLVNFLFGK